MTDRETFVKNLRKMLKENPMQGMAHVTRIAEGSDVNQKLAAYSALRTSGITDIDITDDDVTYRDSGGDVHSYYRRNNIWDSKWKAPTDENGDVHGDAVNYTFKDGDTFGQVLLDLGLASPETLWGEDGDVAYYTQQLRDQGINGNINTGQFISLRPRNRQGGGSSSSTPNFLPGTSYGRNADGSYK